MELALDADSSGSVDIGTGVWRVESSGTVFASIGYAGGAALAGYPVPASAQASASITVVP